MYKVFRPGEQYEVEKNGYKLLISFNFEPKIIPNVEFIEGFGPDENYFAIKMEKLNPLIVYNKSEEDLTKLKGELTQVLEKLWDEGYRHGDVVRYCSGENVIAWDNFMLDFRQNPVLIDLEHLNTGRPNEEMVKIEQEDWEKATFSRPSCP